MSVSRASNASSATNRLTQRERVSEVPRFGARHVLVLLAFVGFFNVYAMRVNLSVAIVAMVNNTAIDQLNNGSGSGLGLHGLHGNHGLRPPSPLVTSRAPFSVVVAGINASLCMSSIGPAIISNKTDQDGGDSGGGYDDGPFVWDEGTQSLILGCFFYGYIVSQLPAGYYAQVHGGKILFGLGVLLTSVLTLLMPLAAKTDFNLLVIVRVLSGLTEGVTFPTMHAMLSQWAPPLERSRLATVAYSGCGVGTVVSMATAGVICQTLGWEAVFYITGLCGVVWFVFWTCLIYDTPSQHPFITLAERDLIEVSLGKTSLYPIGSGGESTFSQPSPTHELQEDYETMEVPQESRKDESSSDTTTAYSSDDSVINELFRTDQLQQTTRDKSQKVKASDCHHKVPWKHMFKSRAVWALTVANVCQSFSGYLLLTEVPTFIAQVLRIDIGENAILSALPYLVAFILSVPCSMLSDWFISSNRMSVTFTRKTFATVSCLVPAVAFTCLAMSGDGDLCDPVMVTVWLCVATGASAAISSSLCINQIDLAPNYAGTLMGITNTALNVMGFVAPMIVGKIVGNSEDLYHWKIVFVVGGLALYTANVVFVLFGTGQTQHWNNYANEGYQIMETDQAANSGHSSNRGPISTLEDNSDIVDQYVLY